MFLSISIKQKRNRREISEISANLSPQNLRNGNIELFNKAINLSLTVKVVYS